MSEKILLCKPHLSGNEMRFIEEAFADSWVVPLGPNVNGFEEDLEKFFNHTDNARTLDKKIVALCSGTSAVHLALIGCGVKPGDEVIVQSFTFAASANPITYLGASPVFVDSEPETWNMDSELLEVAITDRIKTTGKKPKAIITVALYGMPYNIKEIKKIAEKYNIPVIEDAAEGFGSKFDGRNLGTFGDFGVLSFNGNKMITTSGGGALICKDEATKRKMLFYATQARESYPYYHHNEIGYNYRMSNICAGIGRGQMTIAEEHIAHHHHVQELYRELLKDIDGIRLHENPSSLYDSNFWLSAITLRPDLRIKGEEGVYQEVVTTTIGGAAGVANRVETPTTEFQPNSNVEALRVWLDKCNIESRPLWKPMHLQPVFSKYPAYLNGISETLFKTGLCLPTGPWVSDKDVNHIVDSIRKSLK